MAKVKENNFTEGKIFAPLISFTIPILFALVLQACYGMADLLIVGQFGSAADVAAVSNGTMLMHTVQGIVIGLSMGTTVLMGRRIGEGRTKDCGHVVEASIYLFLILGTVLALAMVVFSKAMCNAINIPPEAFNKCVSYIVICGVGLLFITAYNVLSSIMRGMGNSSMPLITVAIASVINILGDLLLVGVFNMAATGAAIATVGAQAISVIISVILIKKSGLPFTVKLQKLNQYFDDIKTIIKLGTPIALSGLLVSLSFLVLNAIVNAMGVIVSAGVGVAEKLCSIIMLVPDAFNQSLSAVVAQNIGANKPKRARKVLVISMAISFAIGIVMAYVAFFHGVWLSRIFSKDMEVCLASAEYLKGYAIDTLLTAYLFCFLGFFNGYGKTTFVMIQGLAGAFCVRIPVAIFMSKVFTGNVFMLSLATPSSSAVQIILCLLCLYFTVRQEKTTGRVSL